MISRRIISRPLGTLSMFLMLATGGALTAASSTAQAAAAKPVIMSDVFTDDGDEADFMDYTDDLGLASQAAAAAAPVISAPAAPSTVPAPRTQGIIMRDGGVCDPIRHMGC